jgi:hypothetical protein
VCIPLAFVFFFCCSFLLPNDLPLSVAGRRYNGAQRARNKYEPMRLATRNLLDTLFCDHNRNLATLVNGLPTRDGAGPTLLPRHGYACVD